MANMQDEAVRARTLPSEELSLERLPRRERIALVDEWLAAYVDRCGVSPHSNELERLADALLHEELADRSPYKVAHEEYPILSEAQLRRRRFGRSAAGGSNMRGEVALDAAGDGGAVSDYVAADGFSYARPTRRPRSLYESAFVEERTISRVADRAATYLTSMQPGEVRVYYLK